MLLEVNGRYLFGAPGAGLDLEANVAIAPDDTPFKEWKDYDFGLMDETPDTIVGVINVQQFLLDPQHRLDEALEFPSFVPETMNLLQLFQALQRQKRSLAIALDEFGAFAGVVRMEDILGEVLGGMVTETREFR